MPVWWVSEPYVNLWLADEPLEYTTSKGERIAFRLSFKQRDPFPDDSSEVVPATGWNHNWFSYLRFSQTKVGASWSHNSTMQADFHIYLPGGGLLRRSSASGAYDPESRLRLENAAAPNLPPWVLDGWARPARWEGRTGFRVIHPDGAQDMYEQMQGFIASAPGSEIGYGWALLTAQIDKHGNTNRFYYNEVSTATNKQYFLEHMVDYDGKTNYLRYTNNLLAEVENPYGQKALFKYDSAGQLTNIVDAAGLSSSMKYDDRGWVTNLTTPYGSTAFKLTSVSNSFGTAGGHDVLNRGVQITEADGSKEAYVYQWHTSDNLPESIPGGEVPYSPLGTLDDGTGGTNEFKEVRYRNSWHWNKKQAPNLSGTIWNDISNLSSNDFRLARWKHWLRDQDALFVSGLVSFERDSSPDGTIEGQKTFYDYANKPYSSIASNGQIAVVTRLLPNGQSQYTWTRYNIDGFPTNLVSTYSLVDGSVGTRTNLYEYGSNLLTKIQYTSDGGINYTPYVTNSIMSSNVLLRIVDPTRTNIQVFGDYDSVTNTFIGSYLHGPSDTDYHKVVSWSKRVVPRAYTNAVGDILRLTYRAKDVPSSIKLPTGLTTTNTFSSSGLLTQSVVLEIKATNSIAYETNNLPKSHTDERGLTRTFLWDNLQRLTSISFPDGTTVSNRYQNLDRTGFKDRLNQWTYFGYDSLRRVTAITNANGSTNVTRFGYCGCGSLESVTNALGEITTFGYDNQFRHTSTVFHDTSSLTYQYDIAGRMTNMMDGAGRSFRMNYNHQGLPTVLSNSLARISAAEYDVLDRVAKFTNEANVAVSLEYDALSRLRYRTLAGGGKEEFIYSTNGLVEYRNPTNHPTRYWYDQAGRMTAVTNANTEIVRADYNAAGDLLALTNGNLAVTRWSVDQYGRVTNKVDALGTNIFRFAYDANDRLTNRWTPAKGDTRFTYDPVGNLLTVTYSNSPSITYEYDALNQLRTMIDAVGTSQFTYTGAGQLLTEDGPWSSDTVTLGYTQGLRTSMTLTQPIGTFSQTYAYDAMRRLTNTTSAAGAFSYSYDASHPSLISRIGLPNTSFVTNSYNVLGQLTQTALKNRWGVTLDGHTYAYDLVGLRTNLVRQIGIASSSVSYGYDAIGQLRTSLALETNGTTRLNEKLGYAYDSANNLLRRTNNGLVQTFTTDALNQLTGSTRSGDLTAAGAVSRSVSNLTVNGQAATVYKDRTYASTSSFALTNGENSFTAIASDAYGTNWTTNTITLNLPASVSFSSDANGNLLYDGKTAFAFDDENQLIRITETNKWKSEFTYDGFLRRRVRKEYTWTGSAWSLTNETRYVYDGNLAIQERDGSNIPLVSYTRGPDLSGAFQGAGGIGGLLARTEGTTSLFYHSDANGNVTALSDSKQNVPARYLYDPFGNLLAMTGPFAAHNLYRYSSKEVHRNSGLYSYGYRFYEPSLQRWLNQDPIGEAGGINLAQFVSNDPANRVDPFGWSDFNRPPALVLNGPGGMAVRYGPPVIEPRVSGNDYGPMDVQEWLERQRAAARARNPAWVNKIDDIINESGGIGMGVPVGTVRCVGLGSTARLSKGSTLARNIREQMAIEEAMSKAASGTPLPFPMTDPRWPGGAGWVKMEQVINPGPDPIRIHYVFNKTTGAIDDFKIILPGRR